MEDPSSRPSTGAENRLGRPRLPRFWHALIAVLLGNAVYFLLVDPRLPPAFRHQLYKFDWGVVIDFWICLFFWGVIEMIRRRRR